MKEMLFTIVYSFVTTVAIFMILLLMTLFVYSAEASTIESQIKKAVYKESMKHNLDPDLVLSIIEVESAFNVHAVGKFGEVGLMQLSPRYFPEADSDISSNIATGVKHLSYMKLRCPNKTFMTWITCYNKGATKALERPRDFPYYKKVIKAYTKRQSRL